VGTGAGASDYFEEGFIDIADDLYSFRFLPALVASSPHHRPSSCSLLLGVPQLNELDIRVDVHRKQRHLPLSSYDPAIILAEESLLECRLSEKDLETWARYNASKLVESIPTLFVPRRRREPCIVCRRTGTNLEDQRAFPERFRRFPRRLAHSRRSPPPSP
jgi:hypothetical protein